MKSHKTNYEIKAWKLKVVSPRIYNDNSEWVEKVSNNQK